MATAPVSSTSLDRLYGNSKGKNAEHQWNPIFDVTISTGDDGFWKLENELHVSNKIKDLKRRFHINRYLKVAHLPINVTKAEVKEMLRGFPVSSIELNTKMGIAGQAHVYIDSVDLLDEWDKKRIFQLRDKKIPVGPTPNDRLLCITRLPITFPEEDFNKMVQAYGPVNSSFLMISERTGNSKGYGFVDYKNKENASVAKVNLHGMKIEGSNRTIWAEFIDDSIISFDALHSKCLHVANLPPGYYDMTDFRKRFSTVATPLYCQIAIKNGFPQKWGLVEFRDADEAEVTFSKLNNSWLLNCKLQVSYHVPGVYANTLIMKTMNDMAAYAPKGNGLLPDPPQAVIMSAFNNLRKQNPVFALNLENIMFSELVGVDPTPCGPNAVYTRTPSPQLQSQPAQPSPRSTDSQDDSRTKSRNSSRPASPFSGSSTVKNAKLIGRNENLCSPGPASAMAPASASASASSSAPASLTEIAQSHPSFVQSIQPNNGYPMGVGAVGGVGGVGFLNAPQSFGGSSVMPLLPMPMSMPLTMPLSLPVPVPVPVTVPLPINMPPGWMPFNVPQWQTLNTPHYPDSRAQPDLMFNPYMLPPPPSINHNVVYVQNIDASQHIDNIESIGVTQNQSINNNFDNNGEIVDNCSVSDESIEVAKTVPKRILSRSRKVSVSVSGSPELHEAKNGFGVVDAHEVPDLSAIWDNSPNCIKPTRPVYKRKGPKGEIEEVPNPLCGLWTPIITNTHLTSPASPAGHKRPYHSQSTAHDYHDYHDYPVEKSQVAGDKLSDSWKRQKL